MSDNDKIRSAADALAGYATTANMRNTLDWMYGLQRKINDYLDATGDSDRVTCSGNGLQTVTLEELSNLDEFGYPKR